jgi:hypothetical protein
MSITPGRTTNAVRGTKDVNENDELFVDAPRC